MSKSKRETTQAGRPDGQSIPTRTPSSPTQDKSQKEAALDPTKTELALIAAMMLRSGVRDLSRLANEAYDLWEACAQEIAGRRESRRRPFDELREALPTPKEYPVSLKAFLQLMLPRRRGPDRLRAYRHFLMDWKNLTMEEAGDLLHEHKNTPADNWGYPLRAHVFSAWIKADFSRGKKMNGLKGHKHLSKERFKAEEMKASEECRQAAAKADADYLRLRHASFRGMIV